MPAAYDSYDYESYWEGREYENDSEKWAIKSLLTQIPQVGTLLDIGAGFGRLTGTYIYRAKKVLLSDPSSKLLAIAKKRNPNRKVQTIHSGIDGLLEKIKPGSVDTIVMVRVMHHLTEPTKAFEIINRLLSPGGYLILEFANKKHLKKTLKEFLKGNFTFPIDIFPKDIRSKKSLQKNTIPFVNYHPDAIMHDLELTGFKVLKKRSVSNIRIPLLKTILTHNMLIWMEKKLQIIFTPLSAGPSIFVLAQKKKS